MSLKDANRQYSTLASNIGKAALSALYPKEFEAYIMGLELTDSQNNTIDYFAFPIMPHSITKTEPKRVMVKKSSSGVNVISSNSFIPEEISLKGDFGRNFKFMLSPRESSPQGVAFSVNQGVYSLAGTKQRGLNIGIKDFSLGIKTGYGAFSIFKAILSKSTGVDSQGKPFRLYLYNMALGESYLVTVSPAGLSSTQTMQKNMIWEYAVTFNIIAPLEAIRNEEKKTSLVKTMSFSLIQQGVNTLGSSVASLIT